MHEKYYSKPRYCDKRKWVKWIKSEKSRLVFAPVPLRKTLTYHSRENIEEEIFFTDGTITMMKEYYENGKLEEQYNLKNRTYVEYNEDGTIDEEGEIDDITFGVLVGVSALTSLVDFTELVEMPEGSGINKEYYENGIIKEEISYKDGKLNGVSKEYYENGSLKSESTFKDGVLDGKVIEYYPK